MAREKPRQKQITVESINNVGRDVNIAAGNIIQHIQTIQKRALIAEEKATRARKLESKLLARGIAMLMQNLSARASEGTESDSPYKGLLPYSLNEAEIFYGREKARKDLLNHIWQSPLTVLHAESGAGKSSLLQAGVAAHLIATGQLAIHLRPHHADPVDFIKRMFLPELAQAPRLASAPLREFLRQVNAILGPQICLYLLLDQFEEFFRLKKEERQPFLEALADCVNDPGLNVRWVLALRKEALSDLAELEVFGISQFKNTYRLNRLSRPEAQEAIIEPARRYGISFEQALIDHILDTLATNNEVPPTHLQLVCSALADDLPEEKNLTLNYYIEHEGDTEGILRDYLKRQLEDLPSGEQALAWKILRALITAERQRAVKTYNNLVQDLQRTGTDKQQVDTILARLLERRLLFMQVAPDATVELAHDYLIKEIELDPQEQALKAAQELLDQESRTYKRHKTLLTAQRLAVIEPYERELIFSEDSEALLAESRKAVREEKRNYERRRKITIGASLGVAIVMSLLAIWGFGSSQDAQKQAATAQAASTFAIAQQGTANANAKEAQNQASIAHTRELVAQSSALRDLNFAVAALLGVEAFNSRDTVQTRGALIDNAYGNLPLRAYLRGHTDIVASVAYSPDGKMLASSSSDHTIILWDVKTQQPIGQPLREHTNIVLEVVFSPDGKTLASSSADNTIILWDVQTRQPIGQPLHKHTDSVYSIAFSPDGKTLASGSWDNTIILWDVGTGQPIDQPLSGHTHPVNTVAFSPDGKTLASGSDDLTIILWDVGTGQPIGQPLSGHTQEVSSVAFSPDGKTLASGAQDSTIRLWDLSTGQLIGQPLQEHKNSVFSVTFSRDGKIMASGSADRTIIVWDAETRQPIGQPLKGHTHYVNSVAFSPDPERKSLASAGWDSSIILWDVETDIPIGQTLIGHTDAVRSVAFSPDGKKLVSGGDDATIMFWDILTQPDTNVDVDPPIGQPTKRTQSAVISVAFSPDGKMMASGSEDGSILLWDVKTRLPVGQPLKKHEDSVLSVAFSPDGTTLASASADFTVRLWNVKTNQPLGEPLGGHTDYVNSVAFSPDGSKLASGSRDRTIIVWDMKTRQPIGEPWSGHKNTIYSVAFSPDGNMLASASFDTTVILWNVETGQPIDQPLSGHTNYVISVAFSTDGKLLASGSRDNSIILWDVESRLPIGQPLRNHTAMIYSVAFSPDGKMLASASVDRTILLWNIDSVSLIEEICKRVGRNFTQQEWVQYFSDKDYHITCPQWPEGE